MEQMKSSKKIKFDPRKIFHPAQLTVWENFLWGGINILAAGRRFGKSHLACYIIILSALSKVGMYFWVAPSYKMTRNAWRNLKKIATKTFQDYCKLNETDKRIEFPNGSIIEVHSADSPQDLRSEGLRGCVLDEAAKIAEEAWTQALKPSLTDYDDSWCLMISTPFGRNWFWNIWMDGVFGRNNVRSHTKDGQTNFSSYDNPHVSHRLIDLDRLTMRDDEFKQEHMAEFINDKGRIFERKHFKNRIKPQDFVPVMRYISLDSAATSNAKSAFSCFVVAEFDSRYRLFIREVYRTKVEYTELEKEVVRMANKYFGDGLLCGIVIEYASSGISLFSSLKAVLPEEISELLIKYHPRQSKEDRAREASMFMEKDRIFLPFYDDADWLVPFEEELLAAPPPKDGYMDQVDSFSNLCKVLYAPLVEGILYSN